MWTHDPATATITFSAAEVEELSKPEESDGFSTRGFANAIVKGERLHLERKVERAFFESGKALMECKRSQTVPFYVLNL